MAASNFTLTPTKVIPLRPIYNNNITQSEGHAKQYQNLDGGVPEERFKLIFERMSDSDYLSLVAHYNECYGGYDNFSWTTVPSYIDTDRDGVADGSNMTGRWLDGSLSEPVVNAYDMGDIEIIFIKDV